MTALVAIAGLLLVALLAVAFIAGVFARPTVMLGRVETQLGALRNDIAGYRAAQENQTMSLDRRLLGLEQTTAQAANEVRMVSDQVLARLPAEPHASEQEVV